MRAVIKSTASMLTKRECLLVILLLGLLSLFLAGTSILESRNTSRVTPQSAAYPKYDAERWRTQMTWSAGRLPPTTVVSHVPGWTIFDNLFLLNGTVFIVTDDPATIPERKTLTSTGVNIANGAEAIAARFPTDRELRVIRTDEAEELFGTSADLVDGTTWMVNDPPQFINHYYHWSAELFFGFWRTYSSLDESISENGKSVLPALRRIWFVHARADRWRDYASMNQWVLRSVFPSATAEYAADWQDRAAMGRPMVFDRLILSDRSAAMEGDVFPRTRRTASEAFSLPGSVHWWSLVRGAVTAFSGFDAGAAGALKPVITYISRQDWGRRKLIQEDHERLVDALYKLRDEHGVEVNVVSMDRLTHAEQIRLAARTTIMMGVHGNGLTALVWMHPTPQSTVIEFLYPGGFTHDYEYTTHVLGMVYHGVWNDKTFTHPDIPPVNFPDGFQGNSIPLDGEVIARLCLERLQLPSAPSVSG